MQTSIACQSGTLAGWMFVSLLFSLTEGLLVCYGNWWFCMERDGRRGLSSINVNDLSNRSMVWTWKEKFGRWTVSYYHTFPSGDYSGSANFTRYYGRRQTSMVYDSTGKWMTIGPADIKANPWNITYNGETFGFMTGQNGKCTYNLFTRNLTYPYGNGPIEPTLPTTSCQPNTTDRIDYPFWWMERKSKNKCSLNVNRETRESPLEWNWQTDAGAWRVQYYWDDYRGIVTSMVFYNGNQVANRESRVVIWQFDEGRLTLTYIMSPTTIVNEDQWKISVKDGETFGFVPTSNGQWNFTLFSRNLSLRPFVNKDGIINL